MAELLRKEIRISIIILILSFVPSVLLSQITDSLKKSVRFSGTVTVTTKGISMVPNLSLGKPAAIFDLAAGKKKLSFEPSFRFALEGKPWSFLFWWRYKLLESDKVRIVLGAHPALSFKTYSFLIDGVTEEHMVVRRYLAGELAPTYLLNKNFSIGGYFLYSYGIEPELVKNNTMVALRPGFSNIRISENYFMRFIPQVYYLRMDHLDGIYVNASLAFARRNFPLSVAAMANYPVNTEIVAGNELLWNISIIYSFGNEYTKKQ